MQMKSPKLTNREIQPLTEKELASDSSWLGLSKQGSKPSELINFIKPLVTIQVMVAHSSVTSSKPKVELDSHTYRCVVGDSCLVIHYHNRPVNINIYYPKYGHGSAKKVDVAIGY